MLISRNWLQSYFEQELPSAKEIADLFALHAFEVEGIEKKGDDEVIEIDVLPNRAHDALGHWGVARELAALLDMSVVIPEPRVKVDDDTLTQNILTMHVASHEHAPRVTKRLVTDVKVGPSPDWLVAYLEALGQRSINNVVDITNFVMLETGQPVHAFDYDKLTEAEKKTMHLRYAEDDEQITMLDGKEFTLDASMLVFADDEKALDIAGIKGGENSGVDENTKRIIVSICNFDHTHIRKTSRMLGLITDASKRFGQGLTATLPFVAQERTAELLQEYTGGTVGEVLDLYPTPEEQARVSVSLAEINGLLGTVITVDEVMGILNRLNFSFEHKSEQFDVTIPFERLDLRIKQDLIEEVGRVYGYNNIASQLLTKEAEPAVNKVFYYAEKIRDLLVEKDFSEIATYTLVADGAVKLANPFASDKAYLRKQLSDNMRRALTEGDYYKDLLGKTVVKAFDIGTVFSKKGEHVSCALGVIGMKPGKIENLLNETKSVLENALDTTIDVKIVDGVFEFNLTALAEQLPDPENYDDIALIDTSTIRYTPISVYPFISRDIAIWTPEGTKAESIKQLITEKATDLLVRIDQFDEFSKDGRTSYAFKLVFQSHERTLTDDEVGKIMEEITMTLNAQNGYEVR